MLFFIGTIFCGLVELQHAEQVKADEGEDIETLFENLMSPPTLSWTDPVGVVTGIFSTVWGWLQALWAMFTWDYSFFTGSWTYARYFFFCISIGVIVSLVLAVGRGVSAG